MTGFEALFAFYALLLGLALANVSNAFADMYRLRRRLPVGWTVPLLGAVLTLCVCQQWISLYHSQKGMTLGAGQIFGCLAVAMPYIVISRLMLPHEGEADSMEAHYAAQRRLVVWMLMAPVLTSLCFNLVYDVIEGVSLRSKLLGYSLYHGARIALLAPMLLWPSPCVQRTCLVLLGLYTLSMMF